MTLLHCYIPSYIGNYSSPGVWSCYIVTVLNISATIRVQGYEAVTLVLFSISRQLLEYRGLKLSHCYNPPYRQIFEYMSMKLLQFSLSATIRLQGYEAVTVFSRENWLSPVIQATWEARTVEWLENEGSLRPGRMISEAALWPTGLGRPTEEVKLLWRYS